MHPALMPANGQQYLSREHLHTPPREPHTGSPALQAGLSPEAVLLPAGSLAGEFAGHTGELAGCKKQALPRSHSQALLPEQMNFSYGMLRSCWLSQSPPSFLPCQWKWSIPRKLVTGAPFAVQGGMGTSVQPHTSAQGRWEENA